MACDRKVILLVSDGEQRPSLASLEYSMMLAKIDAFKDAGGIVICVGIRAAGEGYALLQQLATPGFFENVFGEGTLPVTSAITNLISMMGYYCAGTLPASPVGQQVPDPLPLIESEDNVTYCPVPDPLPQLPDVMFNPLSGETVINGAEITLSVPGHDDAEIRYTMDLDVDPTFAYAAADATGQAYEGVNAPFAITVPAPSGVPRVRAIARKTGYRDSNVTTATYVAGP